jgi:hypothetical protein
MSHTSKISSIKIVDITAFEQAVNDLVKQGMKIEMHHNVLPVAYYANQEGLNTPAHTVLKIEGAAYDVALYDVGQGQYELRTDFWAGSVRKALGANAAYCKSIDGSTKEGVEELEQAQLGQLYQRYAYNATMNTVAQQGGSVEESVDADGSIQLVIRNAA